MDDTNLKSTAAPSLPAPALAALQQGNKIEAIKIVREERKLGLKEAKDAVEDYVRNKPDLQSSFAVAQAASKRSALTWLLVLIAMALITYFFLGKS